MLLKQNLKSSVKKLSRPIHAAIWDFKWMAIKKKRPCDFHPKLDKTATKDGTLHKDDCILVPHNLRWDIANIICSSHLGVEKCKNSVWDVLFLPDMNAAIKDKVPRCEVCSSYREQNVTETTYTTWDSWLPLVQGWQRPFWVNEEESFFISGMLPRFLHTILFKDSVILLTAVCSN